MFEIQALKAKHGDCLLLHWDHENERRLALIDGGPAGVFDEFLRPALIKLADTKNRLRIDLIMLSHIDDDHVNGLLDLAHKLEMQDGDLPDIRVANIWHNSLEELLDKDLTGGTAASVLASAQQTVVLGLPKDVCNEQAAEFYRNMVLASVKQGQQLHGYAVRLGWQQNRGFTNPPLVLSHSGANKKRFAGLSLTIVAPALEEVERLRDEWVLKRDEQVTAAYRDRSVFNLSSIVVLVEKDGKSLLLTGDARGDHIIAGLKRCGRLVNGKIHVDVLKLPHHGSKNNVETAFYNTVTANHYIVSGDQVRFPNPSRESMEWLRESQGDREYRVHCTYQLEDLVDIFGDRFVGPGYGDSVRVDLEKL